MGFTNRFTLKGLASILQLGKDGKTIKGEADHVKVLDNDETTLVPVRVATPVDANDAVIKSQHDALQTEVDGKQDELTEANGIDIDASDNISVQLAVGSGDMTVTGMTNTDYNQTYEKLSIYGQWQAIGDEFTNNTGDEADYTVWSYEAVAGTTWYVVCASNLGDIWTVFTSSVDPSTWVNGTVVNSTLGETKAWTSETSDGKERPAESESDISYAAAVAAFLEFDNAGLKVKEETDVANNSADKVPTANVPPPGIHPKRRGTSVVAWGSCENHRLKSMLPVRGYVIVPRITRRVNQQICR